MKMKEKARANISDTFMNVKNYSTAGLAQPTVSVVMPAYNVKAYLEEAVRSVMNQSFQDWELVVVDDASTDETPNILQALAGEEPRLVVERLAKNCGVGYCRNRALELAKGRFVAFLDSDDRWHPEKLARQLAFMQKKESPFTFTAYEVISATGDWLSLAPPVPEQMNYHQLLGNSLIGCSTVILDREQIGEVRFPEMRTRQDFALWCTLLRDGRTASGLGDVLTQYRLSPSGISKNKWKGARQHWRVYREYLGLGLFKATRHFISYAWNASRKHRRYRAGADS
jgi:teichuronic acid biosynthesis glycosyltransferase TuaG